MANRLLALGVCVFSFGAWAQSGFELDLSEPEVPAEFRPTLGVVGVTAAENDPLLQDRARQLEAELLKAAQANASYGKVVSPADLARAIGGDSSAVRKCADYACFDALAKKLKVDRLVLGTVAKSGVASMLTVTGFDPGLQALVNSQVESGEKEEKKLIGGFAGLQGKSQAVKDKEFLKKATPVMFDVLQKINTPNGKLEIDTAEPSAVTLLNGNEIGTNSFSLVIQRGGYDVKVEAPGYLPYETRVTIEPQKVATVKVVLVAKPIEKPTGPVASAEERGTPMFKRPGLYLAIAGAAAIVVGAVIGAQAQAVGARAVDDNKDGIVDVSRAELKSAQQSATTANVLIAAGAVALVGGGLWVVYTPGPKGRSIDSGPSDASGPGVAMGVSFGGTF